MITVLHGLEGQSLLEVIRASDYQLRAPCAGRGTCRKCRVQLHDAGEDGLLSVPTTKELEQLSAEELASGIRFACLTRFQRAGELSGAGLLLRDARRSLLHRPAGRGAGRAAGAGLRPCRKRRGLPAQHRRTS